MGNKKAEVFDLMSTDTGGVTVRIAYIHLDEPAKTLVLQGSFSRLVRRSQAEKCGNESWKIKSFIICFVYLPSSAI